MRPTPIAAVFALCLLVAAPAMAQTNADVPASDAPTVPDSTATEKAPANQASAPAEPAKVLEGPQAEATPEAVAPAVATAEPWYSIRPVLELGFLAVLKHDLQFGKSGTYFSLAHEGGQDNLFFVWRASIEAEFLRQHTLTFLYQPLQLDTSVQLRKDLVVDDTTFAAGTPLRMSYGFPFYRLSYLYDFFDDDKRELAIGVSVQIRNATINYLSGDGSVLKAYRDIGVVPLLKARGRYNFDNGMFAGFEIDGIYAPISGINGSDNEVVGSLLDASVRVGVKLPYRTEAFLNVRYLGGGAVGQSDPEPFKDGYTKNWLHFLTVSLGASFSTL